MKTPILKTALKTMTLGVAAVAAFALLSADAQQAQAQFGIHIGGRNGHIDIGNPHGYGYGNSYRQSSYRSTRAYYPQQVQRSYYRAPRAHYDYHDTSHYDYHPAQAVRHGNHIDVVPGHYDYHQQGHYDTHYGGHGRGHGGRH